MPAPPPHQLEGLLSQAFGRPIHVASLTPLPPWAVARAEIAPGQPATVIVKWRRDRPRGARTDPDPLRTEAASLGFLDKIGFGRTPRLLAADANLLVIEDLAPRRPLNALLVERGQEGCRAQLMDYARTLGELGACTVDLQPGYKRIRSAHGLDDRFVLAAGLGPGWTAFGPALAAGGLAPNTAAAAELASIDTELSAPGPFLVFSNGDVQVNNFLAGDGGDGRLIDFEGGGFRHALAAGALIHTPGPAWMTVTDPFAHALEAAFRAPLAAKIPQAADDDRFGRGLAAASLAWACMRLTRLAQLDARPVGDDSRVQMLATLEAAAGVARRHRQWPHASAWADRAAATLRRRWPDADIDLAALKPYTPRR